MWLLREVFLDTGDCLGCLEVDQTFEDLCLVLKSRDELCVKEVVFLITKIGEV